MAAANKPIWVQVAEAGFGDRLAELGWKQVSPAHWRLDGDGVIWRTMLGPAPEYVKKYEEDISGCFADESGFELAGLDDLIRRLHPGRHHRWLNRTIRRGVRVHLTFSIGGEYYDRSIQRRTRWEEENPPRKASLWERVRYLSGPEIWSGPGPLVERLHDMEPALRSVENVVSGWWDTNDFGVAEVSARLTRHWEAYMKPRIDAWATGKDTLEFSHFTEPEPDKTASSIVDVYAHYVVGDLDYCRRRLRAEINRKVPTLEEELAWLKKVRFFRDYPTYGPKEKKATALRLIESVEEDVRHAREVARTLDLKLD